MKIVEAEAAYQMAMARAEAVLIKTKEKAGADLARAIQKAKEEEGK